MADLPYMHPSSLRVLVVHNAYQQRGGEDAVVEAEIELLRSRGHPVETYLRTNLDAEGMSASALAVSTVWSFRTINELSALIQRFKPDVIHSHNAFPLISPSLFWAASRARVPVVQTLHNFRLTCLNALLMYQGKPCEDCVGHAPWRGVVRGCYRESRTASAGAGAMLMVHRGLGTFRNRVSRYIVLNEFSRLKFIEAGLPEERLMLKPNFVDLPEPLPLKREGLLYVGRLSVEKGVATLGDAARRLQSVQLRVVGGGPEEVSLTGLPRVKMLGILNAQAVHGEMNRALALVLPSICYENFPRTIAEAFACGTPVIASRIGALAAIVEDGVTGLLAKPGDAQDLAEKMAWAHAHPEEMMRMGENARQQYLREFTGSVNYARLMEIYRSAMMDSRREFAVIRLQPEDAKQRPL